MEVCRVLVTSALFTLLSVWPFGARITAGIALKSSSDSLSRRGLIGNCSGLSAEGHGLLLSTNGALTVDKTFVQRASNGSKSFFERLEVSFRIPL